MSRNKLKLINKNHLDKLKKLESIFYNRIAEIRKKKYNEQIEEIRKIIK